MERGVSRRIATIFVVAAIAIAMSAQTGEQGELVRLIEGRKDVKPEEMARYASFFLSVAVESAEASGADFVLRVRAVLRQVFYKGYGNQRGDITFYKAGKPSGALAEVSKREVNRIDEKGELVVDTEFVWEWRDSPGPGTHTYDVAKVLRGVNGEGWPHAYLVGYDTFTVTVRDGKIGWSGDVLPRRDDAEDAGGKAEKKPDKEGNLLPDFAYRTVEKAEKLREKTIEKRDEMVARLEKRLHKLADSLPDDVGTLRELLKLELAPLLGIEKPDSGDPLEKLLLRDFSTETKIDGRLKNALYSIVDKAAAKGLLSKVDRLAARSLGRKGSTGLVKDALLDDEEEDMQRTKDAKDYLRSDRFEAEAFLAVSEDVDPPLLDQVFSVVPFKIGTKAYDVVKGTVKLTGLVKKFRSDEDRELAKFAANAYREAGKAVGDALLGGSDRDEAIANAKAEFLARYADDPRVDSTKYSDAGKLFDGLVGLMDKNAVIGKFEKIRDARAGK